MGRGELSKRENLNLQLAELKEERSSFESHWKDLSENILPRRSRFSTIDVNKGQKRNSKIIDITPILSSRTLQSGLMSGVTSPARAWFKLDTPGKQFNENQEVALWLDAVTAEMRSIFLRSNLYNKLSILYGDIGTMATGCIFVEEDFDTVLHVYDFPIGSYYLSNNRKLQVDTFFREFRLTVRQLVEQFGKKDSNGNMLWDNFTTLIKELWDAGRFEEWIDVVHCIKPNPEFNSNKLESKFKKFMSAYYERGSGTSQHQPTIDHNKFLRESGYDLFPVLAPRWEVAGEDVYGTNCPGMTALGDCRQLQLGEKRVLQAVEKNINPPMVAPTDMRNTKASILPGDITYMNSRDGQQGFKPAHEVRFPIAEMESKQDQVRRRIGRAYFEDLFLMLAQTDRREITAREIEERHEEKLLALGPVLERLNQDLLDPLIDIAFNYMVRQGRVPTPPEELQGRDLKVEYISVMAQAQKLVGIAGIERFHTFVANAAGVNPEVIDKVDYDQSVDIYGEITSVAPSIVRSDEDVATLREQRAKAQQAAQAAELAKTGASAAKDLSQSDTSGENALTDLLNNSQAGQAAAVQ